MFSIAAFAGCKKKGGNDINAACEDVFAHAEKNDGKWTAGKGDKKVFMDYCVTQKPAIVRCASMEIDFDDKDCKELTGVMAADKSGFEAKRKLSDLRDGRGGDTGAGAAGSGTPPAGGSGGGAMNGGTAPASGELPTECKDYQAAIEALSKCDKLPQATRDALKQSFEQTSAAWASVPAEGRAALGTACKAASDAVKQSATACN